MLVLLYIVYGIIYFVNVCMCIYIFMFHLESAPALPASSFAVSLSTYLPTSQLCCLTLRRIYRCIPIVERGRDEIIVVYRCGWIMVLRYAILLVEDVFIVTAGKRYARIITERGLAVL